MQSTAVPVDRRAWGELRVKLESGVITALLHSFREGDSAALGEIFSIVLPELRRRARILLSSERPDHTLQPTALVNEAYLRLFDSDPPNWENGQHFIASTVHEMRRVLVDHARRTNAVKRKSGPIVELTADIEDDSVLVDPGFLISLDQALCELAAIDERSLAIVEMIFFGGLNSEEVGAVLDISSRTVERQWRWAKAWLRGRLYPRSRL